MNRRNFLKLCGTAGISALIAAPALDLILAPSPPPSLIPTITPLKGYATIIDIMAWGDENEPRTGEIKMFRAGIPLMQHSIKAHRGNYRWTPGGQGTGLFAVPEAPITIEAEFDGIAVISAQVWDGAGNLTHKRYEFILSRFDAPIARNHLLGPDPRTPLIVARKPLIAIT